MRHSKIHTIGVTEEVDRRNISKVIFEDKMVEHFPELMKSIAHRFKKHRESLA